MISDRLTDICDSRVAFATENVEFIYVHEGLTLLLSGFVFLNSLFIASYFHWKEMSHFQNKYNIMSMVRYCSRHETLNMEQRAIIS